MTSFGYPPLAGQALQSWQQAMFIWRWRWIVNKFSLDLPRSKGLLLLFLARTGVLQADANRT